MIPPQETKLLHYAAGFIAFVLNIPKLLAVRKEAVMAVFWDFQWLEWCFQLCLLYLFTWSVMRLSLGILDQPNQIKPRQVMSISGIYIGLGLLALGIGMVTQLFWFNNASVVLIALGFYSIELIAASVASSLLLRIIWLLRQKNIQEEENQQLKNAQLEATIALLQSQINPHFFFNTLTSLSAIVREEPAKAQVFIKKLSQLFRHTLDGTAPTMIPLSEELKALDAYTQLMQMRFENRLIVKVAIEEPYKNFQLPRVSLQPLVENAIKHNASSLTQPLSIDLFIRDGYLVVRNQRQPLTSPAISTDLGLHHLNERYRYLTSQSIVIEQNESYFTVRLPLVS